MNKSDLRFANVEHKNFYQEKLQQCTSQDTYTKALIYSLGIADDTRRNIDRIYDFSTGYIKPECLQEGWQTSTSAKVTRLAFNLYTDGIPTAYDESYAENRRLKNECLRYTPSELFCCSYAPFFWQAVQIRYPQHKET